MPKIDTGAVPVRKGSGYPHHSMSRVQRLPVGVWAMQVAFGISA